jgi:hypothetical protein
VTQPLRWSIAAGVIIAAAVLILAIPVLAREPLDRISVRSVARQAPPAPTPAAKPGPAAELAWTLPPGWTPAPAKPMRLAVFAIEGGGECGLFLFPGGGDRLANVNRWRGQAGLAPLDAAELGQALTSDACAFGPLAWLVVKGESKAFLAAMLDTPGGQCFVKLEAPPDRLDALHEGFLAFCRSLRPAGQP